MNKIVATMTSWKGRIPTTARMIKNFLESQTRKPDLFYLWLSSDEFPNKEKDLPEDLIDTIAKFNVQLKWLDGNEYCHKRWYVYPEHYDDYVISIDDDCFYSPTIIEDSLQISNSFKNTVCCFWWQFSAIPTYDNDAKISWKYDLNHFSLSHWFNAQAMIPPRTFPLEALNKDVIAFRNEFATKHDEAWLIPFFLKNNTIIGFIPKNFPHKTIDGSQDVALSTTTNEKKVNEYKQTEISLYHMLRFTRMLERYKNTNPGYNYERISKFCCN